MTVLKAFWVQSFHWDQQRIDEWWWSSDLNMFAESTWGTKSQNCSSHVQSQLFEYEGSLIANSGVAENPCSLCETLHLQTWDPDAGVWSLACYIAVSHYIRHHHSVGFHSLVGSSDGTVMMIPCSVQGCTSSTFDMGGGGVSFQWQTERCCCTATKCLENKRLTKHNCRLQFWTKERTTTLARPYSEGREWTRTKL